MTKGKGFTVHETHNYTDSSVVQMILRGSFMILLRFTCPIDLRHL